jgi:hypothetical protein
MIPLAQLVGQHGKMPRYALVHIGTGNSDHISWTAFIFQALSALDLKYTGLELVAYQTAGAGLGS